jgi:glycosyltransferase involved in cell wall biosynthesis
VVESLAEGLDIGVFGIRTIPSTYSGYETFCTVMLPELVERGHRVTLYTRGSLGRAEPFKGVKRIGLPSIPTKQLDTLSHSVGAAIVARFKRHDAVLSFNVANSPALSVVTKTGTPTVLNVDGQEWIRGKWGSTAKRIFYQCAKFSKHAATTLVTDCNAMADIYQSEFSADSVVIPYCWTELIDEDHRIPQDDAYLKALGLENRKYIITGGRLIPENHIAEMTRSHIASDLDMPIVVLGAANYDSPVQRELPALAKQDSRVRLLGHVDDRRGFGVLLRDAAMYLHGHSVGGINPSIIEAMGVGAVISAYDTPFNREAAGDIGHYFSDPSKAVQQSLSLLEEDSEDRRSGGIQRVHDNFSLKAIVDQYEQLLIDTANGR